MNDPPRRLWVDDERRPPTGEHWMWAKTSEEAILTLQACPVTHMSLDYQLANKPNGDWDDGGQVMVFLRDHPQYWPSTEIEAHSGSVDGRVLLEQMIEDWRPAQ